MAIRDTLLGTVGLADLEIDLMVLIGGQNRADFFKSLRESAKSAVRALFADFFRRFADFVQTFFDVLQTFCRLYLTG